MGSNPAVLTVENLGLGSRTARAVIHYTWARTKRKGSDLPNLWLADRGGIPLGANGQRLAEKAGLRGLHAHR